MSTTLVGLAWVGGLRSTGCANDVTGGHASTLDIFRGGNATSGGADHGGCDPHDGATGGGTAAGAPNTAGASCTPPASGGPRHPLDADPGSSACADCHGSNYRGGVVYTTLTGSAVVAEATVTLAPTAGGTTLKAVTASDGFFLVAGNLASSYTPCVSKCPDTICGSTHTDTGDCNSCHDSSMRVHLP